MADLKRDLDTVVILLMENRSFDHMLGYLGLPPYDRNIEGLQIKDDPRFANPSDGNGGLYSHRRKCSKQVSRTPRIYQEKQKREALL